MASVPLPSHMPRGQVHTHCTSSVFVSIIFSLSAAHSFALARRVGNEPHRRRKRTSRKSFSKLKTDNITKEHIGLALAWAKGDITYTQVANALDRPGNDGSAYRMRPKWPLHLQQRF